MIYIFDTTVMCSIGVAKELEHILKAQLEEVSKNLNVYINNIHKSSLNLLFLKFGLGMR